jgi:type VI secretion system secreted protein VgrG
MVAAPSYPESDPRTHIRVALEGDELFDVRRCRVTESMSQLFSARVLAVSRSPDVDFDPLVGQEARVELCHGPLSLRTWTGLCSSIELVDVEDTGVSHYEISVVPAMWLLTERRNRRMFQGMSEPAIALAILREWGIEPELRLDLAAHEKHEYRLQYDETDQAFVCRILEEAGVSFYFEAPEGETRLVLAEAPQNAPPRTPPLAFIDDPSALVALREHVCNVRVAQQVRPGRYVLHDVDHRLPAAGQPRFGTVAADASGLEARLERFHYRHATRFEGRATGDTPIADRPRAWRTVEPAARRLVERRLDAERVGAKVVRFSSTAYDLGPGAVVAFSDHPRADLAPDRRLLIVATHLEADVERDHWPLRCEAVPADRPYRPPLTTPRPRAVGVESATVVGPPGEEIHVDELGRVRVHFHWDRESRMDDGSSCWIPVSQGWAGAGYGLTNLPRVGHEVLVDFLGADPDRPMIVGRLHTYHQKTPYLLPKHKTQSGWRSCSTGGNGGYNEIMFEDLGGRELLRVHAQRDKELVVRRNRTTSIGASCATSVGASRSVTVGGDETHAVRKDRAVYVEGEQLHAVKKGVVLVCDDGSIYTRAKESLQSDARLIGAQAADRLMLQVAEQSLIVMTPSTIVLQAPEVAINPGLAVATHVMAFGSLPTPEPSLPAPAEGLDGVARPAATAAAPAAADGAVAGTDPGRARRPPPSAPPVRDFDSQAALRTAARDNAGRNQCAKGVANVLEAQGFPVQRGHATGWHETLPKKGWVKVEGLTPQTAPEGAVVVYRSDEALGKRARNQGGGKYGHVEIVAKDAEGKRVYISDKARWRPGGSVPDNFEGVYVYPKN